MSYTQNIINFLNDPKFSGTLDEYSKRIYYKSKICGDVVILFVVIKDNKFLDIKYELNGCALNVATFEVFCEYLIGEEVDKINSLNSDLIKDRIGVWPDGKNHCVDLGVESFKEILK